MRTINFKNSISALLFPVTKLFKLFFIPAAICMTIFPPWSCATEQPKSTLAFFVGHSQWQKGGEGLGLPREWDYCNDVAEEVVKLAPQYHMEVKVFYRGQGSYGKAVAKMHQEKNKWSLQAPVLSCHYNLTPVKPSNVQKNAPKLKALFASGQVPQAGTLMGTLVLYKPTSSSKKLAEKLLHNVQLIMPPATTGFTDVSAIIPISANDRGAKEILSPDPAPVMLLEIGYGDNPITAKQMLAPDFKQKLAEAILNTFSSQSNNG